MAYAVDSMRFSINDFEDGTAVETWINGLTITTLHSINQCIIGNATVLVSVWYE